MSKSSAMIGIFLQGLLSLGFAGCGPTMPTQEQAHTWYQLHKASVDSFEKTVLEEASKMPYVVHGHTLPCPMGTESALPEELANLSAGLICANLRRTHHEKQGEASRRFAEDGFVQRAGDAAGIASGEVRFRFNPQESWGGGKVGFGNLMGYKIGTTPADKGIRVDDRQVGWGLYQGAYQRSGQPEVQLWEGYRPGITVEWTRPLGEFTAGFQVLIAPESFEK